MSTADSLRERLRGVLTPQPQVVSGVDARLAAVLIPLLMAGPEPRVVFTRRTENLTRHPGEISFPGGLVDPGEDLAAAALREAEEELGIAPGDVELLGTIEPVHTHVSGILVVPFVGMLSIDPRFTPSAEEIAEVLEYPLSRLASRGREQQLEMDGRRFTTFLFDMDGKVIWGATGKMLWSFIELLKRAPALPKR